MKKATKKKHNGFDMTFLGEHVELLGRFTHIDNQVGMSLVSGYLLDIDDTHYYLGTTPDEVSTAVRISATDVIQIIKPTDPYDSILDNMDIPKDGNFN